MLHYFTTEQEIRCGLQFVNCHTFSPPHMQKSLHTSELQAKKTYIWILDQSVQKEALQFRNLKLIKLHLYICHIKCNRWTSAKVASQKRLCSESWSSRCRWCHRYTCQCLKQIMLHVKFLIAFWNWLIVNIGGNVQQLVNLWAMSGK